MTTIFRNPSAVSTEQLQKAFGLRIKHLRKKSGMSQEKFAEQIDRSVAMVSGLERGLTFASLETLVKIAAVMGCSLDELFCFDPDAKPRKLDEVDEIAALLDGKSSVIKKAAVGQVKAILTLAEKLKPETSE